MISATMNIFLFSNYLTAPPNCVKKDFCLVYFNARSLPKNICKIDEFLNDMKRLPDVIAISETKLHANSVSKVHISNYKLLHTDYKYLCRCSLSLHKDTIKFRLRNNLLLKLKHCEDLWLELECKGLNLTSSKSSPKSRHAFIPG